MKKIIFMFINLIVANFSIGAESEYEYTTVTTTGASEVCHNESHARSLAKTSAKNKAYQSCRDVGKGWSLDRMREQGYISCNGNKCSGKEVRCKVTQATYICSKLKR